MIAEPALKSTSCKAAAPTTDDFQRISELPLFTFAQDQDSAHATPLLADAWADAIVCYWNACLAAGSIDPAKPLYLLDPSPGRGRLAWLLIRALRQRLAAAGSSFKPCYVACSSDRNQLDALTTHPYFANDVQEGWLDTALWNGQSGNALHLRARRIALLHTDNPVVALCLQWFRTLPSDLFGVHDGRILEGHAAVSMDESNSIAYAWHEMDDTALSQYATRPLLEHCLNRYTSATLLIPVAACKALDAIAHLSCGRYLLLSADEGTCSEQQVRLGAFSLPATLHTNNPALAVNYHALSLHQMSRGASIWNRQLQDGGIVLHAACRDDSEGIATHAFPAMTACLEKAHPDDIARLSAFAPADPAALLTFLRISHYDPQVLSACMETMLEHAPELVDTARKEWQSALSHVWTNHLPTGLEDGFYYDIGILAARLGHWGLAKECFRFSLACYGDDAMELHHLACCESATGNTATALTLLESALQLQQPGHPDNQELHATLAKRLQGWHDTGWYHADIARDNELTLEPLGLEHAEAMLYQYRDAQIGVMTRLPELNTPDQVKNWIEEQNREMERASYAVMHACWGFIGVVSVQCAGDAGYFYFWIGTDFQDRGCGQRAARLLFKQMARNGIDNIFTSAYRENTRSRKALERIGFIEADIHAQPPDTDLVFFYRPQSEAVRLNDLTMTKRLRELCEATNSPFVFS